MQVSHKNGGEGNKRTHAAATICGGWYIGEDPRATDHKLRYQADWGGMDTSQKRKHLMNNR
jgi:hypothetical protein